jgi:hypothetical protein
MNDNPTLQDYPAGNMIGAFDTFNLYECQVSNPDDHTGILKIATKVAYNARLDREGFVLQTLKEAAERIELEYGRINPGQKMNYNLLFPVLEATFLAPEQGNRRVNIIHFPRLADNREDLVPLSNIIQGGFRVEPKSGAWVIGKFLKTLVFTHSISLSVVPLSSTNLIIHPKDHLVTISDWSEAILHTSEIPEDVVRMEISTLARIGFRLLGGDPEEGTLPESDQLEDDRFREFLMQLVKEGSPSALQAHQDFYALVESMWGRKYEPFTTIRL